MDGKECKIEEDWKPNPELYQRLASLERTEAEGVEVCRRFVEGVRRMREELGVLNVAIVFEVPVTMEKDGKTVRGLQRGGFTCGHMGRALTLMEKERHRIIEAQLRSTAD